MTTTNTKAYTQAKPIAFPDSAKPDWICIPVEFAATAYAPNDMVMLAKLPLGLRPLDYTLNFPDIDTGAAAFAFSLGIALNDESDLSAEVWATGLTAGQSTSIVRMTTSVATQADPAGLDTQYPAANVGPRQYRKLAMKITAAAAVYAGAGKVGYVNLLVQA